MFRHISPSSPFLKCPVSLYLNPHAFRHSQASLLIQGGCSIVEVSKRLGHAKTSTTIDIYSHLLQKSDEKLSDTLFDMVSDSGIKK